jgi:uncharacterized membrane protein
MDGNQELLLGLTSLIVGGVELRIAVASIKTELLSLKDRVDQVEKKQGRKNAGSALASFIAIVGLLSLAGGLMAADTLVSSAAAGAGAGAAFGPQGAAIGAAAGVLLWFGWRRWQQRPSKKLPPGGSLPDR